MSSKRRFQKDLSTGLVQDKLAEIFYQLGYISDKEDVVSIQVNTTYKNGATTPVIVEVQERKKILLINHNEGKTT